MIFLSSAGFSCQDEEAVTSDDVIDFISLTIDKIIGNWVQKPPSKLRIDVSKFRQSNETSTDAVKRALLQHTTKLPVHIPTSSTITCHFDDTLLNNLSISTTPSDQTLSVVSASSPTSTPEDDSPIVQSCPLEGQSHTHNSGMLTVTVFHDASIVPSSVLHSALTAVRALFSATPTLLSITAVPVTAVVTDHFSLQTGNTAALALSATRCPVVQ